MEELGTAIAYLELATLTEPNPMLLALEVALKLKSPAKKYLELATHTESKPMVFVLEIYGFEFWEAHVLGDRIYARAQYWLNMTKYDNFTLANKAPNITVCEHMDPMKNENDMLSRAISHQLSDAGYIVLDRPHHPSSLHCTKCATQVLVEIKKFDDDRDYRDMYALVITKWQYLGAGVPSALNDNTGNVSSTPVPEPGIRDVFESVATTPFDKICTLDQAWEIMNQASRKASEGL